MSARTEAGSGKGTLNNSGRRWLRIAFRTNWLLAESWRMCRFAKGREWSKASQTEVAACAVQQIHGVVRELQGDYGEQEKR